MGRKKRIWIPHHFYHVICRGNRRDSLFQDTGDFDAFLSILTGVFDVIPYELAAYCLMTNHYHLLIKSMDYPVSKVMSLINKRYANYYNTRFNLTGHVFEKRYFDKIMITDIDLLEVSRYIHLNPVKANMVKQPEAYVWSSFSYYQTENTLIPGYMNLNVLQDCFLNYTGEEKGDYSDFVCDNRSVTLIQ